MNRLSPYDVAELEKAGGRITHRMGQRVTSEPDAEPDPLQALLREQHAELLHALEALHRLLEQVLADGQPVRDIKPIDDIILETVAPVPAPAPRPAPTRLRSRDAAAPAPPADEPPPAKTPSKPHASPAAARPRTRSTSSGGARQARITAFTSSLSGTTSNLAQALTPPVTLTYALQRPALFTQLRLIVNDIEIDVDLPRERVNDNVTVTLSMVTAVALLGSPTVTSVLRGTLTEGRPVTSRPVTLFNEPAVRGDAIYASLLPTNTPDALPFAPANRIALTDTGATFSLGPAPAGHYGALAIPADRTLASVINTRVLDLDEQGAWPPRAFVQAGGVDYAVHTLGPLRDGAAFTYLVNLTER